MIFNNRTVQAFGLSLFLLLLGEGLRAQGKYAVLPPDSLYVKHEMAPMFETLIEGYGYNNEDIYILNLNGQRDSSSFYYYFTFCLPFVAYL